MKNKKLIFLKLLIILLGIFTLISTIISLLIVIIYIVPENLQKIVLLIFQIGLIIIGLFFIFCGGNKKLTDKKSCLINLFFTIVSLGALLIYLLTMFIKDINKITIIKLKQFLIILGIPFLIILLNIFILFYIFKYIYGTYFFISSFIYKYFNFDFIYISMPLLILLIGLIFLVYKGIKAIKNNN